MEYRLLRSQAIILTIYSKEYISSEFLKVANDEVYEITCSNDQRWKDWFCKSKPTGYVNIFATLLGLRVKKAKCFCLCGIFNTDKFAAFPIGNFREVKTEKKSGTLSFFANDTPRFYFNNKGSVQIKILRIK